jgi:hypothetical protein
MESIIVKSKNQILVSLSPIVVALIFFSVLQFETVCAQRNDSKVSPPPHTVEIPGTQSLNITSSVVVQEYDLYINLPRDYQDTTKTFPVVYLLDAQWDFPLLCAVFGEQYYDGFVPGIIIVGITWGGKNPDYDYLRTGDLTPTNIKEVPQSGNAPKFLDFIKKELIPFIDTRYRTTKDDRTLMGSSLGGLFTLYALFRETELFDRYVLTSPALGWDNEIIYSFEKNYAEKKSHPPVRLFMAMGGLEQGLSDFQKFVDHLQARNYKGLDFQTRILEGIGHSGSKAEGYTRGLQAVFARPSMTIYPAVLDQYVGTYRVNPEVKIRILREDDHLIVLAPGATKITPYAETEKDFYVKGLYLFFHFRKDDKGKVTGFQLEQFAGKQFLEKVD